MADLTAHAITKSRREAARSALGAPDEDNGRVWAPGAGYDQAAVARVGLYGGYSGDGGSA